MFLLHCLLRIHVCKSFIQYEILHKDVNLNLGIFFRQRGDFIKAYEL